MATGGGRVAPGVRGEDGNQGSIDGSASYVMGGIPDEFLQLEVLLEGVLREEPGADYLDWALGSDGGSDLTAMQRRAMPQHPGLRSHTSMKVMPKLAIHTFSVNLSTKFRGHVSLS